MHKNGSCFFSPVSKLQIANTEEKYYYGWLYEKNEQINLYNAIE